MPISIKHSSKLGHPPFPTRRSALCNVHHRTRAAKALQKVSGMNADRKGRIKLYQAFVETQVDYQTFLITHPAGSQKHRISSSS